MVLIGIWILKAPKKKSTFNDRITFYQTGDNLQIKATKGYLNEGTVYIYNVNGILKETFSIPSGTQNHSCKISNLKGFHIIKYSAHNYTQIEKTVFQ